MLRGSGATFPVGRGKGAFFVADLPVATSNIGPRDHHFFFAGLDSPLTCSPAIPPEQDPTEQARTELNAMLSRQRLLNTEIQTRKTRIKEIKEAQKRKNGGVGSGRPKGAKVTKSGAQIEEHRVEDEIRLLEKGILPWDKVLPGLRASGSLLSSARWIGMHVCTCV